ncbi:Uncharacterized protein APZ42_004363, partial [Daphnia magna]
WHCNFFLFFSLLLSQVFFLLLNFYSFLLPLVILGSNLNCASYTNMSTTEFMKRQQSDFLHHMDNQNCCRELEMTPCSFKELARIFIFVTTLRLGKLEVMHVHPG